MYMYYGKDDRKRRSTSAASNTQTAMENIVHIESSTEMYSEHPWCGKKS